MNLKFGRRPALFNRGNGDRANNPRLLSRFLRDESGTYVVLMTLLTPIIVGITGLAGEGANLLLTHQTLQAAADSAATSAAWAYNTGSSLQTQANGITATYGLVSGSNKVTVTVNSPAKSGNFTNASGYSCSVYPCSIEVIVTKGQAPIFSSLWLSHDIDVSARAVALVGTYSGCVLALDRTASNAISVSNNASLTNSNCGIYSNSTSSSALNCNNNCTINSPTFVAGGVTVGNNGHLNGSPNVTNSKNFAADPHAGVSAGSAGACTRTTPVTSGSISPGHYCGGINATNNATVTMSSGVYYIDGTFNISNNATLNANPVGGVTIIINGTYAIGIGNNVTLNITAQSTGPFAGIALFGPRNSTSSVTQTFSNNSHNNIQGAIYFPSQTVNFANNSSFNSTMCTQVIADKIIFGNNASMGTNCTGTGIVAIGTKPLVE